MLNTENLQKSLEVFGEQVVADAKRNLVTKDKVVSGKLLDSIKINRLKVSKRSIELNINMAPYGAFVDQGVSGTEKKYNTKYSYTTTPPPPSAFDGWMVRRGIAPRTAGGQFQSRKSIQFAMSRFIFKNGIEPSYFLTDAVKKNFTLLPNIVVDALELDVKKAVDLLIKTNFNNLK
jgi:hypothetical protein